MDFLPCWSEVVPEEIRAKLDSEINETEENVRNGLKNLREFLNRENIRSRTDDDFLLWFLRAQKYDIKKSQEKLRRYCAMRRNLREFLENVDIDKIRVVLEHQMLGVLPYRDKQGRTIFFTRSGAWDRKLMDLNDVVRCALLLGHFCLSFPMTSIRGYSYIAEARANSVADYSSLFRTFVSHISTLMAMPSRVQRLDVLNEHRMFHFLYAAAKPLLPTKITDRVFFKGTNVEWLMDNYHPSILPYEFGGTMGPLSNESYREKFLEFVQNMRSESAYFID